MGQQWWLGVAGPGQGRPRGGGKAVRNGTGLSAQDGGMCVVPGWGRSPPAGGPLHLLLGLEHCPEGRRPEVHLRPRSSAQPKHRSSRWSPARQHAGRARRRRSGPPRWDLRVSGLHLRRRLSLEWVEEPGRRTADTQTALPDPVPAPVPWKEGEFRGSAGSAVCEVGLRPVTRTPPLSPGGWGYIREDGCSL